VSSLGGACDHGRVLRLRRTPVPAEVVAAVRSASEAAGERHESILAAIQLIGGEWVAGGRAALFLPDAGGVRRIGWEQVERAEWDSEESVLHVWETTPFGTPLRGNHLKVEDPGRFGQLLRERVSASIVVQRHVPIAGKKGVQVVGRRNPANSSAEVSWSFVLDKGIEPDRPGLLDTAEAALKDLREDLGI